MGFVLMLLGVGLFVVSGFLPFVDTATANGAPSLFRLFIRVDELLPTVGDMLSTLAEPALVVVLSIVGLTRPARWVVPALAGVTLAWALDWGGTLMSTFGYARGPKVGYWLSAAGVAVAIGMAMVLPSMREPQPRSEPRGTDQRPPRSST